jgi:hypothetical protein
MSEADDLLLQQDYVKKYEDEYEIRYESNTAVMGESFNFILLFAKKAKMFFHKDKDCNSIGIDMKLLKAITLKCVELRLDRRRR